MTGELISRQAAIDALWAERMKHSEEMERNLETCSFALRADNKARRNRVEEDIEIIKQLPPAQSEQRWIPCGERLPERSVNVLAYIDYCEVIEILSLETDGQGMLYWEDASGDYESLNDVKAWMPLPEMYKEGDTE